MAAAAAATTTALLQAQLKDTEKENVEDKIQAHISQLHLRRCMFWLF